LLLPLLDAVAVAKAVAKPAPPSLVADLTTDKGTRVGSVTITESTTKRGRVFTEVRCSLSGLAPGAHALSIKEVDGGVYNPESRPHGDRTSTKAFGASVAHYVGRSEGLLYWRAVGDLGNVVARADGVSEDVFEEPLASPRSDPPGGQFAVEGLTVAVHQSKDDFESIASAGAVVASGVFRRVS